MLNELTIEANEESFVIVLQHGIGGNDVTCKQCIQSQVGAVFIICAFQHCDPGSILG